MTNVLAYDNYRMLIRDLAATGPAMSLRAISSRAGFSSHSFLSSVVQGKKNVSLEAAEKISSALGLKATEAKFFAILVRYNQASSPAEKQKHLKQLQLMRGSTGFRKASPDQYDYYATWYLPILRELATLPFWKGNYASLGQSITPPLGAQKAREGVDLLCRLGLLRKASAGKFKLADPVVTAEGIPAAVFRATRTEYLLRAIESAESLPVDQRHLSLAVVACSQKHFQEIQNKLDDLRREILLSLEGNEPIERVFAVSFQAFPVSMNIREHAP